MPQGFWLTFFVLSNFIFFEFVVAFMDEFAFEWQARKRAGVTKDFLTFIGNASNWGDLFIVNSVLAYLFNVQAATWSLHDFVPIFEIMATLGAFAYHMPLLADSKTTHSAFFRDGLMTLCGGMHYVYWTVGTAVAVTYYALTPRQNVSRAEVVTITTALMIHWTVSMLHPPYKAHGTINYMAWGGAALGWIILPIFASNLLGHWNFW